MRLFSGIVLALLGIAFVQAGPIISSLTNLNGALTLLPQVQDFIGNLNNIFPQISGVLSDADLQALKDKVVQAVLSQLGSKPTLDSIKDTVRPILEQYLASKPQSRFDIDSLLQQIAGAAGSALPGIIIGLLGKRNIVDDQGRSLDQILSLVDKYQLNTLLPIVENYLGEAQLQQLQTQFFSTVVTALGNNWNLATVSQALQQLFTQYVPQLAQMKIDWDAIGQSALNGLASALPSIAIGLITLFGKREVVDDQGRSLDQILSLVDKYQLNTLLPIVENYLGEAQLQQLQTQFFSTVVTALGNNWNLATVSQILQQLFTQYVPQLAQMKIDWDAIGQSALNGLASALPSIAIGLITLFGKRDLQLNYQQILSQLPINQLAQLVQTILSSDKVAALKKLRELLQQFLANYQNRVDIDELANMLLNQLSTLLPTLSQSIFGTLFG